VPSRRHITTCTRPSCPTLQTSTYARFNTFSPFTHPKGLLNSQIALTITPRAATITPRAAFEDVRSKSGCSRALAFAGHSLERANLGDLAREIPRQSVVFETAGRKACGIVFSRLATAAAARPCCLACSFSFSPPATPTELSRFHPEPEVTPASIQSPLPGSAWTCKDPAARWSSPAHPRSSQAPLPCPGRARKRHALYPLYLVPSLSFISFLVHSCRTLACIMQYDPTLQNSEIAERWSKIPRAQHLRTIMG